MEIATWYVYGASEVRYSYEHLTGYIINFSRNYYWYARMEGRSNFKMKMVIL